MRMSRLTSLALSGLAVLTTLLMATASRMPVVPCLSYGNAADLERQLCEFILRGIGLNEAAIASHLARELSPGSGQPVTAESA